MHFHENATSESSFRTRSIWLFVNCSLAYTTCIHKKETNQNLLHMMDIKTMKDCKITNFFSQVKDVPNQVLVLDKSDFYSNCLAKKLNETSCDSICKDKKIELKRKLAEEKLKLENIRKSFSSCVYMIKKKDEKINLLSEKLDKQKKSNIDELLCTTPESNTKSEAEKCYSSKTETPMEELFTSYENVFSSDVLAKLRSFNSELSTDSTFILTVMRSLYQNDIQTLKGI